MCISWTIKCLILVMHGAIINFTFHRGYKTQSVFVICGRVSVCSEINTEHINTEWKVVISYDLNLLVFCMRDLIYIYIYIYACKLRLKTFGI